MNGAVCGLAAALAFADVAAGACDAGEPATSARFLLASFLRPRNIALCLALSLSFASTWLLNSVGYPAVHDASPFAQYAASGMGAIVALAFAFVSMRRPRLFLVGGTVALALVVAVVSTAGFYVAAATGSAAIACVSSILRWAACILRDIVLGFALMSVGSLDCLAALLVGYFLRYVWIALLWVCPLWVQTAAFFAFMPLGLVGLWWFAKPVAARAYECDTTANLQVTNPLSFLPFTNRMFVAIALFHMALGFSTTFGDGGYAQGALITFAAMALVVVVVLARNVVSVDALYAGAYLIALAGLLFVPFLGQAAGLVRSACNALCEVGSSLFSLVVWYMAARIGARNLAGALPVFCMMRAARGLGLVLGAASGALVDATASANPTLLSLLVAIVAFGFAGYNFVFARTFSFDRTVDELVPLAGPQLVGAAVSSVGVAAFDIDHACDDAAATWRLTVREGEVLRLLARGRNVEHIERELSLKHNTVKSYVADVYRKLGVHSHQELIDLVERAGEKTVR